jgi:hypothetical protein
MPQLAKATPMVLSELYYEKATFVKAAGRKQLRFVQLFVFLSKSRYKKQTKHTLNMYIMNMRKSILLPGVITPTLKNNNLGMCTYSFIILSVHILNIRFCKVMTYFLSYGGDASCLLTYKKVCT